MTVRKPALTARDFAPEVLQLFDRYVHGAIDRRGFLYGAARHALGSVTALGLLEALSPKFAQAQQVLANDARLHVGMLEFESPRGYGKGRGYFARPAAASGPLPTVLVIHENRGLNPHIEDIARRLALDNFIAFAPDALFPLGGYPGNEDKARELFGQLDQAKTREDFIAAAGFLKTLPGNNGKLGAVGFCYGGTMVNALATQLPELAAGAAFYGTAPPAAQVPRIKAQLLHVFAGNDARVNGTWPGFEAALKANSVHYAGVTYPRAEHGFNNDTTPRYDGAAARQAWSRTVALFNGALRA